MSSVLARGKKRLSLAKQTRNLPESETGERRAGDERRPSPHLHLAAACLDRATRL